VLYLQITKLLLRATGNHDQAQVCQTSVLLGRLCWHASVITGQAFPASAYRKDAHKCVKASHTLQSVQQYSSAQDLVLINQLTVITAEWLCCLVMIMSDHVSVTEHDSKATGIRRIVLPFAPHHCLVYWSQQLFRNRSEMGHFVHTDCFPVM